MKFEKMLGHGEISQRRQERNKVFISSNEISRLLYIVPLSILFLLTYKGYIIAICMYIYWFVSAIRRTKRQKEVENELDVILNPIANELNLLSKTTNIDFNDYIPTEMFLKEREIVIRNINYIKAMPCAKLSDVQEHIIMAPYIDQASYLYTSNMDEDDIKMYALGYIRKSKLWDEAPPASKISNMLEIYAYCDEQNGYKPKRK